MAEQRTISLLDDLTSVGNYRSIQTHLHFQKKPYIYLACRVARVRRKNNGKTLVLDIFLKKGKNMSPLFLADVKGDIPWFAQCQGDICSGYDVRKRYHQWRTITLWSRLAKIAQ